MDVEPWVWVCVWTGLSVLAAVVLTRLVVGVVRAAHRTREALADLGDGLEAAGDALVPDDEDEAWSVGDAEPYVLRSLHDERPGAPRPDAPANAAFSDPDELRERWHAERPARSAVRRARRRRRMTRSVFGPGADRTHR